MRLLFVDKNGNQWDIQNVQRLMIEDSQATHELQDESVESNPTLNLEDEISMWQSAGADF